MDIISNKNRFKFFLTVALFLNFGFISGVSFNYQYKTTPIELISLNLSNPIKEIIYYQIHSFANKKNTFTIIKFQNWVNNLIQYQQLIKVKFHLISQQFHSFNKKNIPLKENTIPQNSEEDIFVIS